MSITTNKAVAKAELIARIAAIDALFALPKDYLDFLYSCLPEDVKCKCSSKNLEYDDCYRSARCLDCKGKVRPTAQTIFNNIRRPTDWVRFIFLMAQGFSVSANLFAEVTGMSQSSVSDMSLKIRLIFLESIQGTESALSSMCEAVITKRSERTPAMEHPTAEENEFKVASSTNSTNVDEIVEQALSTLFPEQKHTNGFNFETEKGIFKTILDKPLSLEQIVKATKLAVSEVISALTNLQLADLAQLKSDGHYETTATFKQRIVTGLSNATIDLHQFFDFIKRVFTGVSRKYLQLYFVDYWCVLARGRISPRLLCRTLLKSQLISSREIKDYVTPPVVVVSSVFDDRRAA